MKFLFCILFFFADGNIGASSTGTAEIILIIPPKVEVIIVNDKPTLINRPSEETYRIVTVKTNVFLIIPKD